MYVCMYVCVCVHVCGMHVLSKLTGLVTRLNIGGKVNVLFSNFISSLLKNFAVLVGGCGSIDEFKWIAVHKMGPIGLLAMNCLAATTTSST